MTNQSLSSFYLHTDPTPPLTLKALKRLHLLAPEGYVPQPTVSFRHCQWRDQRKGTEWREMEESPQVERDQRKGTELRERHQRKGCDCKERSKKRLSGARDQRKGHEWRETSKKRPQCASCLFQLDSVHERATLGGTSTHYFRTATVVVYS